jgi:hypothetical protein
VERQVELTGDPAREHEQQAVDHNRDQAEREHVQPAADDLDDRSQHGVDEAEDHRNSQQGADLARYRVRRHLDAVDHQRRDPQRHRGDRQANDDAHGTGWCHDHASPRPQHTVILSRSIDP